MNGLCAALVAPMVLLMVLDPAYMIPAMGFGVVLYATAMCVMQKVFGIKHN